MKTLFIRTLSMLFVLTGLAMLAQAHNDSAVTYQADPVHETGFVKVKGARLYYEVRGPALEAAQPPLSSSTA